MTPLRRVVSLGLIWGVATAFGLAIAVWTRVGPVVLTLNYQGGYGVHIGDLVALAAAYTEAAVLTRRLLRRV